ncbi:MAG: helix-turn-helix domain-containing protein [Ktedonobacteraceae bacterium]
MGNDSIPNKKLQREREQRGFSQEDVAGKIGTTAKIVGRWERGESMPRPYFRQQLIDLFEKNAEELGLTKQEVSGEVAGDPQKKKAMECGFFEELDSQVHETINAHSLQQKTASAQNPGNSTGMYQTQLLSPHGAPLQITIHIHHQESIPTTIYSEKDGIIDDRLTSTLGQERPGEIGNVVNRRELFQEGLHAGVTLLTSYELINNEVLDRFFRALRKPSTIDERTLSYFELRTEGYWRDRHSAALASSDLFSYVIEHLQKVITLLEGSLFPSVRARLCCIASGIAQLAGHLLFDMGEFARARKFHQGAITAAQEGGNQALEAVAWGRMSFTWTYNSNPLEALRCIQEARRLAAGNVNTTVRAYLAAVEAEIQAILGNRELCLQALHVAERVEDQQYPKEEMYWLRFDCSRLAGYQGICFRRLYHPEDARTHSFLDEARQALTDALTLLDPARIQRRPALLIDIAGTYAQQGDVDRACGQAMQALSIMAQIQSQTVVKRLLTLRQELEPWKDTQSVKNLDQQMIPLITARGFRGIA